MSTSVSNSTSTVFNTRQVDCTTAVDNSSLRSKLGVVLGDQCYKRSRKRRADDLVMSLRVTLPIITFQLLHCYGPNEASHNRNQTWCGSLTPGMLTN
jgi:hypothetical protein